MYIKVISQPCGFKGCIVIQKNSTQLCMTLNQSLDHTNTCLLILDMSSTIRTLMPNAAKLICAFISFTATLLAPALKFKYFSPLLFLDSLGQKSNPKKVKDVLLNSMGLLACLQYTI